MEPLSAQNFLISLKKSRKKLIGLKLLPKLLGTKSKPKLQCVEKSKQKTLDNELFNFTAVTQK